MAFTIPNFPAGGSAKQRKQASIDTVDIAILVAAINGNGVLSGCAVTPNSNMYPSVASGVAHINGAPVTVSGGTVTVTAADATNPRCDLVVVNSAGTKSVVAGTAAVSPVFPSIPANSVVLASLYVGAGVTAIYEADRYDKRCLLIFGTANTFTADQIFSNTAPITTFISENNTSGARFNVGGTATTAAYRFQYGGSTLVTVMPDGKFGVGMTPTQQFELSGPVGQKASGTTWSNPSDARLKENIQDYTDGLNVILEMRPISYELNGLAGTPKGQRGISIIAQEQLQVMPYTIDIYKAKLNPGDEHETELYRFEASAVTFALVNAAKELAKQGADLQAQVQALAQEIERLNAEMAALKAAHMAV